MTVLTNRSRQMTFFLCVLATAVLAFPFALLAGMATPQIASPVQSMEVPKHKTPLTRQKAKAMQHQIFLNSIEIVNLDLWPESQCSGSWTATVRNPSQNTPLGDATLIPYQYRADLNEWTPGPGVDFVLEENQIKRVTGEWEKRIYSSKFKVALMPQNAAKPCAEKVIDFILDPSLAVSVIGIQTTDDYVAVTVRNQSPQAICELGVQKYLANNDAPDQWTPAGGRTYTILGNQTATFRSAQNGNEWRAGYDLVKIDLHGPPGSGIQYAEKILPLP